MNKSIAEKRIPSDKSLRQGQGVSTEFKERGLQAAFTINLRIFQAKFGNSRYRYFHFDLNSGDGMNAIAGCIGSPLAFIRAAEDVDCRRFFAGFCDLQSNALNTLFNRPELQRDDCYAFNGDNAELAYAVPDIIRCFGENPAHAIGMVLADPNGSDIPLDAMAWLSRAAPKLDFVINWNSARAKGHRVNPVYGGPHYPLLTSVIEQLQKPYWLIRRPLSAHQFTLLIGRGVKVGDHKALGFYDLNTPAGRAIVEECTFTKKEQLAQVIYHQGALAV